MFKFILMIVVTMGSGVREVEVAQVATQGLCDKFAVALNKQNSAQWKPEDLYFYCKERVPDQGL